MSSQSLAAAALQAFTDVVQAQPGLRVREGQHVMAAQVAETFAQAVLGKVEDGADAPDKHIAVIQAGTGVGKSLAYAVPAITLALARNTRVVISTATVALQEQLVDKDLPALAKQLPQPFKFALAKGRGRYVCRLKLDRQAGHGELPGEDDLFAEEEAALRALRPSQENEARRQFYSALAQVLAKGAWNGDRDTLEAAPEPEVWGPVAADGASCTGRHCPAFNGCSYYEARKAMVGAQVIVANHDLLLSSLGARLLPELDNCLLVLDEAHHLPQTALGQFAAELDMSRLTWIDRLASRALRVGALLEVGEIADIPGHASHLLQHLQQLARLVMEIYGDTLRGQKDSYGPPRVRVTGGVLPDELVAPLAQAAHHASGFLEALRAIAKALREEIRDKPDDARRLSTLYAQLGMLAPRLEAVDAAAKLLLQEAAEGAPPTAKWFTMEVDGDYVVLKAHASPTLPGATLRYQLWGAVRGAVLTSATLTSCGQFDFFLREAGLYDLQQQGQVKALEVASPFDYAAQGRLVVTETRADPKHAAEFTAEMVQALLRDIADVQAGALVLFTSREQMRQAVEALPAALRPRVLVQNTLPRAQLLMRHRDRVSSGAPSVIFGMQSFGEGLDLPGRLCESVFITKLPFAPPDDPVGEARAEWLRAVGRDPFTELVVPATAIRLAQWAGRAIRTEEDQALVHCYDKRLTRTSYGQRLLRGLPPFTFEQRGAAQPAHAVRAGATA
ncbi:MAG: ATP-dependent DNA helicase DinG [Burkholderiales bacterium]|nr:ATP-dependent DNA helicase DinG [Burkholderiales bacterium]